MREVRVRRVTYVGHTRGTHLVRIGVVIMVWVASSLIVAVV